MPYNAMSRQAAYDDPLGCLGAAYIYARMAKINLNQEG
jgi:hypothetical protein